MVVLSCALLHSLLRPDLACIAYAQLRYSYEVKYVMRSQICGTYTSWHLMLETVSREVHTHVDSTRLALHENVVGVLTWQPQ